MLPKDPVGFLQKNVLLIGTFERSGLFWAKLEAVGDGGGVYKLVNAGGDGDGHFPIYWCHYNSDSVHMIALQDQASLMFTPRMSGCTFARGIPASDGTILVGHANIHDGTEYAGIREIDKALENRKLSLAKTQELMQIRQTLVMQHQLEKLEEAFGPSGIASALDRTDARYAGASEITTFGVREGSTWSFYFQARRGNSKGAVTGVYAF